MDDCVDLDDDCVDLDVGGDVGESDDLGDVGDADLGDFDDCGVLEAPLRVTLGSDDVPFVCDCFPFAIVCLTAFAETAVPERFDALGAGRECLVVFGFEFNRMEPCLRFDLYASLHASNEMLFSNVS